MSTRTSNLTVLVLVGAGAVLAVLAVWRAWQTKYELPELPPDPPEITYKEEAKRLVARAADVAVTNPAQALQLLDEAVKIDPRYHKAWADRGYLLLNEERYEAAEASFRKASKLKPHDERYYIAHALALDKLGRPEDAQDCLRRALVAVNERLDPARVPANPTRATVLYLLHRDRDARRQLESLKSADPDSASGAKAARLLRAMDKFKDDRWEILHVLNPEGLSRR